MVTRTFVFDGGTSRKFWSVEVSGSVQTVRYGRVGTAGQTKVKEFADAAAAGAAAEALAAGKVRKGYVEQAPADGGGPAPVIAPATVAPTAPAPAPEPAPAVPTAATSGAAAERATASRPGTAARSALPAARLESRIDLHPHEWAYASWRPVADPPGPPPPFDPARALEALRLAGSTATTAGDWCWSGLPFEGAPSAEEAAAWLWATDVHRSYLDSTVRDRLVDPDAARHVRERDPFAVADASLLPRGLAMNCLVSILPPGLITERLLDDQHDRRFIPHWYGRGVGRRAGLIAGVRAYLLPRLTPDERGAFAAGVRARMAAVGWPTRIDRAPDDAFLLAAQLGLHDELQAVVDAWPAGRYQEAEWDHHEPQSVVFGLGSPEAVLDALSTLRRPWFRRDWHLAAFLAHTGTAELRVAAAQLAEAPKDTAAALMGVLARVHDAEFVAPVLALTRTPPVPGSREWLAAHPLETLVGAARLLARSGHTRDQALELLRARRRAGVDVARALPFLDAAAAARLTELVLAEEVPRELGPGELPAELAHELADTGRGARRRLPGWIEVVALPPVLVEGGGRLADDVVRTVLLSAAALKPGGAAPLLLAAVRAHTDSDALAWALVEAWLAEGAPSSGRWAFLAAGHLGGDRTATRLAPLIRAWPGESQHARAVLGLDVLAAIGSDTALMLLDGIAQKVKFKGLQRRAREAMEQIAEAEGMTKAELEDRIVPDGGLDEHGARQLDFGPRQFDVVLGPGLRPMVRDGSGRVRTALPKPNAKDDPVLAAAAAQEWKLLKKVVGDLVKVQSVRLEQAMVVQRRWTPADFDRFLVRHPLQRHLARLLVWGAWDSGGSLVGTFRVTDELDLADAADESFTPGPDHGIGLVHPLQMTPDVRAAWGELLADYGVVQPFAQLGRPVHDIGDDERGATDLTRFARATIDSRAMIRILEDRGWERGVALDNGVFCLHAKPFPALGFTAVVEYPGVAMAVGYEDDQSIEHCYVLPRLVRSAHDLGWGARDERPVPWGGVDPIVRSEVLADVHAVLAKAAGAAS